MELKAENLVAGVIMRFGIIVAVMFLASLFARVTPGVAQNSTPPPASNPQTNAKDQSKTPPDAPPVKKTDKKAAQAEDNPFPEDVSAAAAKVAADANAAAPDAPGPASGGAPSSGDPKGSSSRDNTDKLGLDDPTRKQLKLESPDGTTGVYDPKRAGEDVRVGQFYLKTGDVKGAYARFKDATAFDHENVEAVFWLAEAANRMNLRQEAAQNFALYLDAVPDGPNSKAARRALGELATSKKP